MVSYFFDTSALANRYIQEVGSDWVAEICEDESGDPIFISGLTHIELVAAILRRAKGGTLSPEASATAINDFDADRVNQYLTLDADNVVLRTARGVVEKYTLRAYDAVQLAVALECYRNQMQFDLPAIRFVSADNELLFAAESEGLQVENPNLHK